MLSAGNGFIMQSDKYSRDNAGQSLKKYILLKQGELAYNHGASKAKQFGCCYELTEPEARIPYVYHCFKINNHEYTPFIAMALNNAKMDKQLKRLVSSSVRMDGLLNISFEDYMSVTIHLPSPSEQKHIADFLQIIDERIATQEKLLASLKKYKRGVLSVAFDKYGSICSWETTPYPFAELASRRSEKYDPRSGEQMPCVELEHIEQETGRIIGNIPSTQQNSIKGVCKSGDTLFGKLRPYLRKYAFVKKDMVCSSEIWSLVSSETIIPEYLFYLVQTDEFIKIANISSGTKMPRAEWSNIEKSVFSVPSKEVQAQIVQILRGFDSRMLDAIDMLGELQLMKEGLLQQLFI